VSLPPPTADICDAYPHAGVADLAFRDYGSRTQFSGAVETVRCFEDNSKIATALESPGEGRVLVVDGGGSMRCALFGGRMGALAVENGWAGIVIEGCVRDVTALRNLPLGVKALGSNPLRSKKRGEGQIGTMVWIGRMNVQSGWWLYADEDGVIALPEPVQLE
jgi:regulator of ribonuclease activity A